MVFFLYWGTELNSHWCDGQLRVELQQKTIVQLYKLNRFFQSPTPGLSQAAFSCLQVLGTVPQSSFAGARGREFCFAWGPKWQVLVVWFPWCGNMGRTWEEDEWYCKSRWWIQTRNDPKYKFVWCGFVAVGISGGFSHLGRTLCWCV